MKLTKKGKVPYLWRLNAFLLRRLPDKRRKAVRDMLIEGYVVKKGWPYEVAQKRVDLQFAMMGVYNDNWK